MIGAIAKLKIKDGELEGFIEVMRKLVQAVSDNEPGCVYYQMHETSDPQTVMMIEVYILEQPFVEKLKLHQSEKASLNKLDSQAHLA